jgi:integrase
MQVKAKTTTRSNDVLIILGQYGRENQALAGARIRTALKPLKRFFIGKRTTEIDIPMCRQYTAYRMSSGVTMSTVARELTTLRAACNHALKWKRITFNDKPTFEIPTDLPRREIWLFKEEIRHIISHSPPVIANFIKIAYGTGSRRRAVETLKWEQCDFHRRTINLAKKGERKTNKRRPTVPMGDLYDLLMDLYETSENEWVLGSDNDLLAGFTRACESAGLLNVENKNGRPAGRITPHILRHSRATHLLEDGVSIYAVSKLLGDNATTVQKTYGHICMSSLEDELNKSKGIL